MRPSCLSRESVLAVLEQLIRIPSVNPAIAPDEGTGEAAIAEFARAWLVQHGVRAWVDEIETGRCNAIGETGAGKGPTLVGCAHLDTVHTAAMKIPPFEPRLEDGRVFGRGSYDMKGGVAAVMAAAAGLAESGLAGTFMVALVADEEYASLGAHAFVQQYRADACIVTEPTPRGMTELITAHKGFVWLEITTHGHAAHGSRWEEGNSAIAAMGRVIAALDDFDHNVLRARVHPLVGPASMHSALVTGGSGLSTYAAECRLHVERRTIPGETPDAVLAEIRQIVGPAVDVVVTLARPPLEVAGDSRLAECARTALRAVTGRTPDDAGVAYWMDAAIFAAAGIETLNFGARGEGAHAAVEWVDLDTVVQCANALYETGVMFCGQ